MLLLFSFWFKLPFNISLSLLFRNCQQSQWKTAITTDDFVAYKDGHEVCDGDGDISIEDSVNEGSSDAPPIGDQGQENVKQRMLWLQIRRFLSGLRFLTQPQRNGKKSICLNDRKLLSNYHMTC